MRLRAERGNRDVFTESESILAHGLVEVFIGSLWKSFVQVEESLAGAALCALLDRIPRLGQRVKRLPRMLVKAFEDVHILAVVFVPSAEDKAVSVPCTV